MQNVKCKRKGHFSRRCWAVNETPEDPTGDDVYEAFFGKIIVFNKTEQKRNLNLPMDGVSFTKHT